MQIDFEIVCVCMRAQINKKENASQFAKQTQSGRNAHMQTHAVTPSENVAITHSLLILNEC